LRHGRIVLTAASCQAKRFSAIIIFLAYLGWSLGLTYPLAQHLFTHIPLGDEKVGTVPFFNLWSLQWNIDQLMQGYPNYWHAPIFAPASGSFAFSETQPLSALLAGPLWLGFQSPALGYNTVVILFLTLNGWFTFWLLKWWGVAAGPTFLAGLLMQSLPFIAQEMGVLQLVAVFGFLWSLLVISRIFFKHQPGQAMPRDLIFLALGLAVVFLTCTYYGLFSLLFLPVFLIFLMQWKRIRPTLVIQLLVVGALALILSGPFLWAQKLHLDSNGFRRSAKTIENNSAKLQYYTNFLDHNVLYSQMLARESGAGQRLFPGLGLVFLASLGLLGRSQQRVKAYLMVAVCLALLLSLGLWLRFGDVQPYLFIRNYAPGFRQLRSPFRFAVLVQLHLVLLAGFGLFNLTRWLPKHGSWLVAICAALVLFESLALPLPLQPVPRVIGRAPWQTWLNQHDQDSQIIMLPFAASSQVKDFEQTTRWMLESRYFQGRMLNGYSGFFPADHPHLREQMLDFPTIDGIELLHELQVDYIVVYHSIAKAPPAKIVATHLRLVFQDRTNNVSIYALDPSS
jgi:hypothetical protein